VLVTNIPVENSERFSMVHDIGSGAKMEIYHLSLKYPAIIVILITGEVFGPTLAKRSIMKILTPLLLLLFIVYCDNPQNGKTTEPIFNSASLATLALDSLPLFWGNTSINLSSSGAIFPSQSGYLDELAFSSSNQRWLGVMVFTDKSSAIAAMEYRIDNVVAVFKVGGSANSEKWWYADSSGGTVILSLSKCNTIVEAVRPGNTFLFENDSLWIPIDEISNRIDGLTE